LLFAALAACTTPTGRPPRRDEIHWRFDRLDRIGGSSTHIEGEPQLIATRAGKALAFDGIDDAFFIDRHPLAGAQAFTMEAVFRPDGGAFEQRWLHLAEVPGVRRKGDFTAAPPSGPRFLFEIRVVEQGWYLDTFVAGPGYNKALIFPDKLHPLGHWYHVAQVYDGRVYRSYVNGELQGEAEIAFQPQGAGYSSVGTRIDRRSYFRGAVFTARFVPRALAPGDFMQVPAKLATSW
jgi:hypothetical protein